MRGYHSFLWYWWNCRGIQWDIQCFVCRTVIKNNFCPICNPRSGRGVQHYVIKICQWLAAGRWFSPVTSVSSSKKTECHYIAEILLKVVLNTIKPNQIKHILYMYMGYHIMLYTSPWAGITNRTKIIFNHCSADKTLYIPLYSTYKIGQKLFLLIQVKRSNHVQKVHNAIFS
jgi:hypothetical protein